MTQRVLTINFDDIREVACLGVRRTAVFMGLGVNAASDPEFTDYQLGDCSFWRFIPDNVPAEAVVKFKEEFAAWVVGCGLRELIETLSVFLDRIYEACVLIESEGKAGRLSKVRVRCARFGKKGFRDKLSTLKKECAIDVTHADRLLTLQKARNCLAHRRGIVGPEDCGDEEALVVQWMGLELFAVGASGQETPLPEPIPPKGVVLTGPSSIKVRLARKEHRFPLGSEVRFAPQELAGLCYFALTVADDVLKGATAYARAKGLLSKPPATEPPKP